MSQQDRKPISAASGSPYPADLETSPTLATYPESTRTLGWAQLEAGTVVARRYKILGTLGVGGMGVVYRAHDQTLNVEIALKVLRPEVATDEGFLQRFRHELVVARRITHRHVIRIHDLGVYRGMHFMTMDMVEGRSLRQIIKKQGAFELKEALKILRQVASALEEAHRQGVIHRDLKPENILIDQAEDAYITDFGIARSVNTPGLTRTGEIVGTPDYLSPEQARGEEVGPRSDLYTLGLIFIEMLSGKLPFPSGTIFEVLAQRISGTPYTLEELGVADVPPPILKMVGSLVARSPDKRLESATQLLEALDEFENPSQARRRRFLFAAVLAALLAGLASFAVARWWIPARPSAPAGPVSSASGPRLSVAVLPFDLEAGGLETGAGDVDAGDVEARDREAYGPWLSIASAEVLGRTVAQSAGLRVLEPLAVLEILHSLGFPARGLRTDQLQQIYQALGVQDLVVGRIESSGALGLRVLREGPAGMEEHLLPAEKPGQTLAGPGFLTAVEDRAADLLEFWQAEPVTVIEAASAQPDLWAEYVRGLGALARGDPEEALEPLGRAAKDPSFSLARLRLARALVSAGDVKTAVQVLQELVPRLDGSTSRLAHEARFTLAWETADLEKAREVAGRWLEQYPFDAVARRAAARVHGELGELKKAMAVLTRAVELDPGDSEAWFMLGRYALYAGLNQQAVDEYLVRALVRRTRLRNESGQAEVYNALGVGYERLGLISDAIASFESAAQIRRRSGDRLGLAATLFNLATIYLMQGEHEAAEENIGHALRIHTELGNAAGVAKLQNARGALEEERGDYPAALDAYREALQVRKELGDQNALAESHTNVGYAYFLLGEFDNAILHLERAQDLYQDNGNRGGVMLALQGLGSCQLTQGEWTRAEDSFRRTLELSGETGRRDAAAVALGNLGRLAAYQGRFSEAFDAYAEALGILEELGDRRGQVEFQLQRAEAWLELGGWAALENALEQVRALQNEVSQPANRARLLWLAGHRALVAGDTESAVEAFREAVDEAALGHSPTARLRARLGLAQVQLQTGPSEKTATDLQAIYDDAEALRDMRLTLQIGEPLAEIRLARGEADRAIVLLRDLLEAVEKAGGYTHTYRLRYLLSQALQQHGAADQAEAEWERSKRDLEALRQALDQPLRQLFDQRPEVRGLL